MIPKKPYSRHQWTPCFPTIPSKYYWITSANYTKCFLVAGGALFCAPFLANCVLKSRSIQRATLKYTWRSMRGHGGMGALNGHFGLKYSKGMYVTVQYSYRIYDGHGY